MLIIGLSASNVTKLVAGHPVVIDPKHPGHVGIAPFGEIAIIYGETEGDIVNMFKKAGLLR